MHLNYTTKVAALLRPRSSPHGRSAGKPLLFNVAYGETYAEFEFTWARSWWSGWHSSGNGCRGVDRDAVTKSTTEELLMDQDFWLMYDGGTVYPLHANQRCRQGVDRREHSRRPVAGPLVRGRAPLHRQHRGRHRGCGPDHQASRSTLGAHMARITAKANKDYPQHGIAKGDTYYYWSPGFRGPSMSKTPAQRQLTTSKILPPKASEASQTRSKPLQYREPHLGP